MRSEPEIAALLELISQNQLAEVEERVGALLRTDPDDGILWKIMSVVLLRQDKDALAALRRAAQLLPQDPEAQANLGVELRARGQLEQALSSLRQSILLAPKNPDTLIEAADVQLALQRFPEAGVLYQEALQIDSSRREALNNLGNVWIALGKPAEAVRFYHAALQLRDDDAQVSCNLANALRQVGHVEEALVYSRRAIELAPTLSMAHNNLGLLLAARGERVAAIASYRRALDSSPNSIEALSNLGNALRDDGQRREALDVLQRALHLDPKRADSHSNLGYILLDCRQPTEAADNFRSALGLQPNHPSASLGLVIAQRTLKQPAEALATCEGAVARAPDSPDALVLLGELRADNGDFETAHELFERAIAADRYCGPAYSGIAFHRRMTRDDQRWLQGAQSALNRPLSLRSAIQLRTAVGKYFDDTAAYDEAFGSYHEANELTKRLGPKYDPAHITALIDRIMRLCDTDFVGAAHPVPGGLGRLVFIIGMPRSGTSLAEQILASHPAVYGSGEVRFWNETFEGIEQLAGDEREKALAALRGQYLNRLNSRARAAERITDKMPANFLYAGLIHRVFPRAHFIHMQRHPLDTCLSIYFQNFSNVMPFTNDLEHLAHYYGQYQRITAHWRGLLPADTLLEVPYEGLVSDTQSWARRMVDFIGLPWDARCLDFHQTERAVITASKWQVRQKITTSSVGRWRNYEKHVAPLRQLIAPEQLS
jgi:tetratricopeptide (TPR) repeat protein